jgi:hypothetical protein
MGRFFLEFEYAVLSPGTCRTILKAVLLLPTVRTCKYCHCMWSSCAVTSISEMLG